MTDRTHGPLHMALLQATRDAAEPTAITLRRRWALGALRTPSFTHTDTGRAHGPWSGVDSLREAPFHHAHYQHRAA